MWRELPSQSIQIDFFGKGWILFFEGYLIKIKKFFFFLLKFLFEFEIFEKSLEMRFIPATSERQKNKNLGEKWWKNGFSFFQFFFRCFLKSQMNLKFQFIHLKFPPESVFSQNDLDPLFCLGFCQAWVDIILLDDFI